MNAAALAPRCRSADELVRRYEALRPPAGDGRGNDGLGRALLMHQGVAAWIEVWANGRAPWAPPLEVPLASGPFGAKGLGELPLDGTAPAIVNAVNMALGTDVAAIPAVPEVVLDAWECARRAVDSARG